jgi:hypothetical protein
MKILHLIMVVILISLLLIGFCFSQQQTAQTGQPIETSRQTNTELSRRTPSIVKKVDFHLRDGRLVVGKLVSEDKNQITVEELVGSKIEPNTYSKRDIDARTMHTKSLSESKYYTDLAEYFSSRTWDFVDDPDDFIQAIRCYEKAKQLISIDKTDDERLKDIDVEIEKLNADRQVWITQTASRAELKRMEFEAEAEKRIKELEMEMKSADKRLEGQADDIRNDNKLLREQLSSFSKDLSVEIETMKAQIESNTALLARIDEYLRWRTWHPWGQPTPPPQKESR